MKALITGGSRGIGFAIANKLAQNGICLILVARDGKQLEKARKELAKKTDVEIVNGDIRNKETLALIKGKKFDILINNAGVLEYGPLQSYKEKDIDNMIETNLSSLIKLSKIALKKANIIINISSGAGKVGYPNMSVYCATKFGVIGFTEALACETDKKIYAVCPQDTNTRMWEQISTSQATFMPEDVANVVWKIIKESDTLKSGSIIDVT